MSASNSRKWRAYLAGLVAGCLTPALTTHGGTNAFYVPSFRGEPGSAAAGWDFFTVGFGLPGNAPDLVGSTATTARLAQLDPAGFVTGSGNIYNQPNASSFVINYTAGAAIDLVVLQTRTLGTELDYSSVSLSYPGGIVPGIRAELDRAPFVGQGPGAIVSSAWTFNLSGLNASDISIAFKADGPSLSFDSATLDVKTVPEPGTWALLATGFIGLVWVVGWRRPGSRSRP